MGCLQSKVPEVKANVETESTCCNFSSDEFKCPSSCCIVYIIRSKSLPDLNAETK